MSEQLPYMETRLFRLFIQRNTVISLYKAINILLRAKWCKKTGVVKVSLKKSFDAIRATNKSERPKFRNACMAQNNSWQTVHCYWKVFSKGFVLWAQACFFRVLVCGISYGNFHLVRTKSKFHFLPYTRWNKPGRLKSASPLRLIIL